MANRIQLRRDTTANWANVNPILSDGEMGYDIVTNEIRIGDGSTAWTGLTANTISGGGGASTGNVTFNDFTIIGTGNIHLQPDDQDSSYLDVFLTGGADVHVTTGAGHLILGRDDAANVSVRNDGNVQIQSYGGGANIWKFGTDGNLTIPGNLIGPFAVSPAPIISGFGSADFSGNVTVGNLLLSAGGQIQSESGTGDVVVEVSDGNNARTWTFTTTGNIQIPSVQYTDFVNIDAAVSNVQTLGQNAYIEFSGFSGEILVNDLYDGYMYKILVGSGKAAVIGSTNSVWTTAAPGVSVTIASYIKIEFTGGKYRFTNLAASRDYNFYTIKTRNVA